MAHRGVHFALDDESLAKLLAAATDEEVLEIVQEDLEETWDRKWLCETDKAWNAIHRCLTDGRLEYDNGTRPLKECILGGRQGYMGEDYVVSLISAETVTEIARELAKITRATFRSRYFRIDPEDYEHEVSEEDFAYVWSSFEDLPKFFDKAAKAGRAVVFTVDL